MRKIVLATLFAAFALSFTSCRQQPKTKVIHEKEVIKPKKKENKGILERTGEKVDSKVNKEVDKKIDKIDDDN